MKIAILTSGILPVPAVQGGAVENLTDYYLEYNNTHRLHDITVYSVWHPDVSTHPALLSTVNHYHYIKTNTWWARLKKRYYLKKHGTEYYHYSIEYFLHEAIKHLRQQNYDMVIMENRPGYAMKVKAVTGAKMVYHLHNEKLTADSGSCGDIYHAATRIITVSDYIKRSVQAISANDVKTVTVYNGIDLDAFAATAAADRTQMGLSADDFVLLFSGRITQQKGILQLIEAMLLLNDEPRIKLLVVGSSFYGNALQETTFQQELRTKASPLANRIIFTGFVAYEAMPRYLKMADVAVVPSVWDDPFPTTVLEAQAMGLPIIATRRGGIPEEVSDGNALLLDTDDSLADSLAAAIRDLYLHPEKRKAMAEVSLQRSRLFSKETYAANFFKALENR